MASLSRRTLLSSLSAALGVGAVAAVAPAAAATAPTRASLSLYGSQLRLLGPRSPRVAGSTSTVRGALHTVDGGAVSGEFFASVSVLAEHRIFDVELGSFQTHLFSLPDATITGVGTVHHDGRGTFTITGGSGRFADARGTYTSTQSADHAGTGTAEFTFKIG